MKIIKQEPVQIIERNNQFEVRFKVKHQCFVIARGLETQNEAEWFAKQFQAALDTYSAPLMATCP